MKIFIAHSTKDHVLIEKHIKPILLQYFYKEEDSIIILDKFESKGKHWQQVRKGIETCDVFVVLVSKNSKKSEIVLNETELALRRKENLIILPILINTDYYNEFEILLNQITAAIYKTKDKNPKNIEDHIKYLTSRNKKANDELNIKKDNPGNRKDSKFRYQIITAFYKMKKMKWTVLIAVFLVVACYIFIINFKIFNCKNDYIIINLTPVIDSLGGDEKFDTISGEVKIDSPENYRIVIYAYTNMWYIQPSFNKPFTDIIEGEWTTETHLGKKYAVILVKKEYEPENMIFNLPEKSDNIIEIKITP